MRTAYAKATLLAGLTSLALLTTSIAALAQIEELPSYTDLDVSSYDQNTWMVFDIDNTLLSPTHMIGSHQWGDYLYEQYIAKGYFKSDAKKQQHKDFALVAPAVRPKLTETAVLALLKELRAQKVMTFTLTAREPEMRDVTMKQLRTVGLLNHNWNGFHFSGSTSKGEFLAKLIAGSARKPQRVIFIDDKDYNVESVEKFMQTTGIEFTAYRYGGVDHEVEAFDAEVADLQFYWFLKTGVIYSDDEAREAIQNAKDAYP
jgi:hypothetical protein